jgi:deoxyribonuclease V
MDFGVNLRMTNSSHSNPDWPRHIDEARAIQLHLRDQVIRENQLGPVQQVAGVDVGFEDGGKTTRAAIAVLDFPALTPHEQAVIRIPTCFPYVPGYLSFRELPGVMQALKQLRSQPDLVLCDGQGIAHPRRFGIACHLGVITGLPTIGVAKSRLIGQHQEPGPHKGDWVPLLDKGETIGAVLRTRDNVSPLYISTGHRVDLPTAIDYVLRCTTRFRLPETTRRAHKLASG